MNRRGVRFTGWLVAFLALLMAKWWTLNVPAAWDASWTVFAGGSTLADNGFDLLALLESPSFGDYGPATHATSPVTWLTGLVIAVFGTGDRLLPILHVLHLMIGGVALQQIYRYARGVWRPLPSLVAVIVIAVIPVVNAQLGFMYLETPQLAAVMLMVNAFLRGDHLRAGAWGAVGTAIKASGIILPLALVAVLLGSERTRASVRRAAQVLTPPVGVAAVVMMMGGSIAADTRTAADFARSSIEGLLATPDVLLLIGLLLLLLPSALRSGRLADSERQRLLIAMWGTLGFFGLYLLLPVIGFPFGALPRYYVLIIPIVLIAAGIILHRVFGARLLGIATFALLAFSLANHNGLLYPQSHLENTVLQERSNGYAGLLLLVQKGIAELHRDSNVPVVVDPNQWARGTYPAAGYVTRPLPNMIQLDSLEGDGGFTGLPSEFVVLDAEVASSRIPDLIAQLDADPRWSQEVRVLEDGRYEIRLIRFRQSSG